MIYLVTPVLPTMKHTIKLIIIIGTGRNLHNTTSLIKSIQFALEYPNNWQCESIVTSKDATIQKRKAINAMFDFLSCK